MEGYWALARRAAAEGVRAETPAGGALVRWTAGNGPEVWAQVDPGGDVVGATPYLSTSGSFRISVTGSGEDPEERMDGWIDGWLEPAENDEPYSGVFPLRVNLVDFALSSRRLTTYPALHTVELIALAHEVDLYDDEAAYRAAPGEVFRLPVQSFVSTAHSSVDEPAPFAEATALASGIVRDAALLVNPVTDATFWRIALATQGVTLQACIAPADAGGPVRRGQILSGGFWLLGRLLD
ncbi:MAG TPA: hypothetical protein VGK88_06770 [bacterium]|jgi:hypothetical protein